MTKFSLLASFILLFLNPAFSQTYYGTTGVIPDNGTTKVFYANVSGLPDPYIDESFGLESVCITIQHPWIADLDVSLMAPDSTYVFLTTSTGGGEDNYTNTCFNGNSDESIIRAWPPYTGTFRPMGDLGRVNNGQYGNGIWQLLVQDIYPWADQGTVISWSLNFSDQPSLPQPLLESDLPIVVIDTRGQFIPDDPKLMARIGIIDNGPGEVNHITDPYNAYDGYVGIEKRGSSSQSFPKKSYGLETWDSAGVATDTSLFGMPAESDWILNANFNDKTLQRNVLTYLLSNRMGRYAARSKYCELVLNGQYWGVYIFMEKVKRDGDRVDINKLTPDDTTGLDLTGGYILKIDKATGGGGEGWTSPYPPAVNDGGQTIYFQYEYPDFQELLPQQTEYIQSYVDTFETALHQIQPGLDYLDYLDLPSFVDYFILNEISRNVDGYRLSTFFYKDRGGKINIGPVWDFDIAWHNADYCDAYDPSGWSYAFGDYCPWDWWQVPAWWELLIADTVFTNPLKCRWEELRTGLLSDENLFGLIDSLAGTLDGAQQRNFDQWPILGIYVWPNPWPISETYEEEVTHLKDWVTQRMAWLDGNMPGACGNSGTGTPYPMGYAGLSIRPNPFYRELKICFSSALQQAADIEIFNAAGMKVRQIQIRSGEGSLNIDTQNWPAGMYAVMVLSGKGTAAYKVVRAGGKK